MRRWLLPDASTGQSPGTLARSPERSEGSGYNGHYIFVLSAGAKVEESSDEIPPWRGKKCDSLPRKAGSPLIIPSVLGFRAVIFFFFLNFSPFLMSYSINSSPRSISHYECKI